ncbi:SpoIIE family protein phosphatase [Pseudodesulfovibrio sp.]|nr:SpoIIE family protein phosphatase [Pseudodesulfovibrio sp.]
MTREKSHELVQDMTSRSREVLITRAKAELLRRMEDHARIVSRERQIVSLALKAQSGRLRSVLEGSEKRVGKIPNKGLEDSSKHFRTRPDGSYEPLQVDLGKIRFDMTRDASISKNQAEDLFKPMIRSFRKLERSNPDLIYWQIVRLTNGTIATYPYYAAEAGKGTHAHWMDPTSHTGTQKGPPPMRPAPMPIKGDMDMQRAPVMQDIPPHDWYNAARHSPQQVFWTPPYRDPVTGKFIVAAVSKIQEFKGQFYGAMMVMVPLGNVLKGDLDLTGMSKDTSSLLVRARPKPSGGIGLQIVAEEHKGQSTSNDHGGWMAGIDQKWVTNEDTISLETIAQNLKDGKSGTTVMEYNGNSSLWVYAPIKHASTSLVLVVPMKNIIGTTVEAENFVKDKIQDQFMTLSALIWGMLVIVLIISLLLSKTMTQRISKIATAFHQLANGDFSARVDVRGHDELSHLSHSFNELAPALEEQVRLKEALTVAQEVQRSLLPEKPPQVKGLDVAGMSMYCEDTGGDYFDYPHLGIEADELGLAVGDVSGHGVPAALLMTTARALLRQRAQRGGNLGAVVGDANKMLAEDVRLSGRFMTLFLFAIDLETHTARWVRAGHDPALVYLPSKDRFSELGGDTGLPLGVDGDWNYVEEHADIEDGSVILIGTDGIWEASNAEGDMFGKDRLNTILQDHHARTAQEILDIILKSLKEFTGEAGFEDDVTLAVVKIV